MAGGMAGHTKHGWGAGWPSWLCKPGIKAGEMQDAGRDGVCPAQPNLRCPLPRGDRCGGQCRVRLPCS